MFFFLHLFLFLLLHRHTTGCAGTGRCGTIISTTVGMCAARRQRGVALHMMTAPRFGVSLFQKEKKRKRGGRETLSLGCYQPTGQSLKWMRVCAGGKRHPSPFPKLVPAICSPSCVMLA